MANIFEKILEWKSRDCACEVLYTQWCLVKEYVPKVQSVIVRTFPHFSLHDSSHSEAILNCITRVLGEDAIVSLSCADLWLLLLASYYHDLGMAVFAKDIETIFEDQAFFDFVKECQKDKAHPLHPFSLAYEVKHDRLYFKNIALDAGTYDGARFLLAEFIRKRHADRSGESVLKDSAIHLAGDPIPERLIRLLGKICEMHTKSFDKLMTLPMKEVGLGTEDCHPRFVAAMLRIGDLLDLDNNRFSDVLLKTLPVIPRDSLLHKKKHLSIEHLRIDSKSVEVWARCDDYDVADITNQWLEMISEEFRRQRDVWQDLVPDGFNAYLPSIGELKVDLDGFDTIDGKKRPGFEMDTSKAIEMLQGAGLYTNPAQCMRELLQNAVDATYLAIFQKEGESISSVDDFLAACKKEKIEVQIDKKGVEGDSVIWHVSIEDYGVGMGKEDIGFLTRTGSKNKEKLRLIEQMPEYMRPSGTFGIGFQSVFLMTEKVIMRTRKRDSSQEVMAEMYNPANPERKGAVLIRTEPARMHYGTRLEFDFKSEKDLDHWSLSTGQTYAIYTVYSYDFVADKTLDLDTARVLDEILAFSRACPVCLSVKLNGENLDFEHIPELSFDYYSTSQGLQVSLLPTDDGRLDIYYRNQKIKTHHIQIPYLSVMVNILEGNAKDLLTLSRNELCYPGRRQVRKRIISTIGEVLLNSPSIVPNEVAPLASMFLNDFFSQEAASCPSLLDTWKGYVYSYHFPDGQWPFSFGQIVEMSQGKPVVWTNVNSEGQSGVDNSEEALIVKVWEGHPDALSFLLSVIAKTHPYPSNNPATVVPSAKGFLLSPTLVEPITDWDLWIRRYLHRAGSGRTLMPCPTSYRSLALKPGSSFLFSRDTTFPIKGYPEMICPYVRELTSESFFIPRATALKWDDANGELYQMAYEHRADPSVTLDDIKQAYIQLRAFMDPIVASLSEEKE